MYSKIVNCLTVTPVFISGADGKYAELRAPSIKGFLRYWWRASNYNDNLESLAEKESDLFGGSSSKAVKSKFSIRIVLPGTIEGSTRNLPVHIINYVNSKNNNIPINLLNYLAFGPTSYIKETRRTEVIREYIPGGLKFQIMIDSYDQTAINEALKSLYILSYFGGIGAKSRNGFGSFQTDLDSEKYANTAKNLLNGIVHNHPKYPSFSANSRLWELRESYPTWDVALAKFAEVYRAARLTIDPKYHYDKRGILAAPLNVPGKGNQSPIDRRSKSYFMSIHKTTDNKFTGRILLLDSMFSSDPKAGKYEKEYQSVIAEVNKYFDGRKELEVVK